MFLNVFKYIIYYIIYVCMYNICMYVCFEGPRHHVQARFAHVGAANIAVSRSR